MKKGFTLIELLIVVLIIGVLTAIALPQYQTATDKSRYATLMPMAKSVANAQEAFYMNGGHYSEDLAYLDVQLPNDPSGTVANIGDGLKVEISEDTDYGYVKMSKEGLENNYIIYQDNSLNYPKEIHCEALSGSDRAERLCKALGGSYISGSLSEGYDTYVLEGGGSGTPWSLAHADTGTTGVEGCESYPCIKECTGAISAWVAQAFGATPSCEAIYQEDGSFVEKACITGQGCMVVDYTENGMDGMLCDESGTVCPISGQTDANGNITSYRSCESSLNIGADGKCAGYDYGYDATYDGNGNQTSYRHCAFDENGQCSSYDYGSDYTYYANGQEATRSDFSEDGSGDNYTFDENGNVTSFRYCSAVDGNKQCTGEYYSGGTYTYNGNGDLIASSSFYYGSGNETTYDGNGHTVSTRSCATDGEGACTGGYTSGTDYSGYDESGNYLSYTCAIVDGQCNSYSTAYVFKKRTEGSWGGVAECKAWSGKTCTSWCRTRYGYTHQCSSSPETFLLDDNV